MAYKGFVVEIKGLRKHENADRLQIATVFGSDVVVGLNVQKGDISAYFPTDGQLSYDFALHAGLLAKDIEGNKLEGYLDPKKRNIKAIRLRGERSDGILVPLETVESFTKTKLNVGDTIDTVGGKLVCQKYIPQTKSKEGTPKSTNKKLSKKAEFPLFKEHADTQQFMYNTEKFKLGDRVVMSLKLHGTSARTTYTKKVKKLNFFHKLFKVTPLNDFLTVSGTRRVILDSFDGGFYGSNGFRKQYHDYFDGKLEKGETVFGEIVGFLPDGKSIMPTVDNKKMKDKDFIKTYGDFTTFSYGCEPMQSEFYVYRMNMTNEDGYVVEYPTDLIKLRCEQMGVKMVPVLEDFILESEEQLMELVEKHTEGVDPIGKTHIREGVILRIENRDKFEAYKNKSFTFKILEGIIKEDALEADMEEAQELEGAE